MNCWKMLADPWTNWCAAGSDGRIYALEVADPVEADALGYEIDGVLVSDFVTPAWFEPTEELTGLTSSSTSQGSWRLHAEVIFPFSIREKAGRK